MISPVLETISPRRFSRSLGTFACALAALSACDSTTAPGATERRVETILVEAPDSAVAVYTPLRLNAKVSAAGGVPLPTARVSWSSSDTSVAIVSGSGDVTGLRQGVVRVLARSGGKSASFQLAVWEGVCVLSLQRRMAVGGTAPPDVQVRGSRSGTFSPTSAAVVTSSDAAVATVSASGVLTAVAPGTVTLKTTCAGGAPSRKELRVLRGWRLSFLGTPAGAASTPWDLNDRGEVVGEVRTLSGASTAVLWKDGQLVALGAPGVRSRALGISASGVVVGAYTAKAAETDFRPFLWREGSITELDPSPEEQNVVATAVNAAGVVVGYAETTTPTLTVGSAVSWSAGVRTDHGRMGGYSSRFVRINDAGQMLAVVRVPNTFVPSSFLVAGEQRTPVPDEAMGLAPNGLVSGMTAPGNDGSGGYLWTNGTTRVFYPGRRGGYRADDVNSAGTVVGTRTAYMDPTEAFLWDGTEVGPLAHVTLGLPSGWALDAATGINEREQIIAIAREVATGRMEAVLLTQQP